LIGNVTGLPGCKAAFLIFSAVDGGNYYPQYFLAFWPVLGFNKLHHQAMPCTATRFGRYFPYFADNPQVI